MMSAAATIAATAAAPEDEEEEREVGEEGAHDDGCVRVWHAPHGGRPLGGFSLRVWQGGGQAAEDELLMSGGADKCVRFWRSGKAVACGRGHTGALFGLCFLRVAGEGAVLAGSASDDRSIRIWRWTRREDDNDGEAEKLGGQDEQGDSAEMVAVLEGHSGPVVGLDFGNDFLASGGQGDGAVKLWDVGAERDHEVCSLTGDGAGVNSVRWVSGAGQAGPPVLVAAFMDRIVRIFDVRDPHPCVQCLRGHSAAVMGVDGSTDGMFVASASWDQTARIWDIRTGGVTMASLIGHTDHVRDISFCGGNAFRVITASKDRTARVWDWLRGGSTQVFRGHTNYVTAVACTASGDTAYTGSWDGDIRAWKL